MNLSVYHELQSRIRNYTAGDAFEHYKFVTEMISREISGFTLFLKYDQNLGKAVIQGRTGSFEPPVNSVEEIICSSAMNKQVIENITCNKAIYLETPDDFDGSKFSIWFVPVKPGVEGPVFAGITGSSLNGFMADPVMAAEILSIGWFIYEKHLETEKLNYFREVAEGGNEKVNDLHQTIRKKARNIAGFAGLLIQKETLSENGVKYLGIIQSLCEEIDSLAHNFETPYNLAGSDKEIPGQVNDTKTVELKTIVVADNDDINFILIENFLKDLKVELIRAHNGQEAVSICQLRHVDMVLMDLLMPVMDGFSATELIKKEKPEIKIIAQTAYLNDRERAFICGCIDLIEKPFRKHQLVSMVNSYL